MDAVSPITDRATLWRLGHMIDAHAETAPGSTALIVGDQRRRITYADLAELVGASRGLSALLGLAERRQEQCGEDADDGYDNQKFDQCKGALESGAGLAARSEFQRRPIPHTTAM